MIDFELQLWLENPSWHLVLDAYVLSTQLAREEAKQQAEARREALAEQAANSPESVESESDVPDALPIDPQETPFGDSEAEFDGWVSRIHAVEDVPEELLSRIHGKLIALGLLKFDICSRTSGVSYQVTRLGRQMLTRRSLAEEQRDDQGDGTSDEPEEWAQSA